MTLAQMYFDLVCRLHGWAGSFNCGDVTTYLQTHYDYDRQKARQIARILHNWIWFGYVPVSLVH